MRLMYEISKNKYGTACYPFEPIPENHFLASYILKANNLPETSGGIEKLNVKLKNHNDNCLNEWCKQNQGSFI